ncbi:c-type cytochrome [Sphingobacterium sp. MYb382]|uniref:c-type cytochrome n=1 Tax=Sphingobacterium sp. MYb382 TaxID=2745278 RepID=UPI0030B47DD5
MRKYILSLAVIGMLLITVMGIQSCYSNVSMETAQYAVNGQKLYTTHCQNCHGAKGEGLGKLYPPLTDSTFLNKQRAQLACIVKHGIRGPLQVNGKTYDGIMPGNAKLNTVEIAYILTYITTTFGNSTSTYTQEEVVKNLENCKK